MISRFEKIAHWYYKTFVQWGDIEFSIKTQRWGLHRLWMWTVGLPFSLALLWIWYAPKRFPRIKW